MCATLGCAKAVIPDSDELPCQYLTHCVLHKKECVCVAYTMAQVLF